jgi:hypothetical protein
MTFTDVAPTIGKLVRLLGSNRDGEVVAAVRALRRVLDGAGLDLHDLAQVIEVGDVDDDDGDGWRGMATRCSASPDAMSAQEQAFISNILRWRGTLSPKQEQWLQDIFERVTTQEVV